MFILIFFVRFVKTSIVDGNLYFRNVLIRGNDKKILFSYFYVLQILFLQYNMYDDIKLYEISYGNIDKM